MGLLMLLGVLLMVAGAIARKTKLVRWPPYAFALGLALVALCGMMVGSKKQPKEPPLERRPAIMFKASI